MTSNAYKHGHASKQNGASPTYRSWISMRNRCSEKSDKYQYYAARGIKVCDRWNSFENFLLDMGERPNGTTIDRINNNGDYEPGNCRWASKSEQINNRSYTRTFNGKLVKQLAQEKGIKYKTLLNRVNKNVSEKSIFLEKVPKKYIKPRVDNKSGFLGVSRKRDKWRATAYENGKQKNLGVFNTPEEAAKAYEEYYKSIRGL